MSQHAQLFALGPRKKYVVGRSRKVRDGKPPFLPDNRRGYARVTPVALSRVGVPGSAVHALDHYPMDGLGIYDDLETCEQYTGYVCHAY